MVTLSPSWKLDPSPPRGPEESPANTAAGRRSPSGASARQLGVVRATVAGCRIRRRARRGLAASPSRHDDDGGDVDRVRTRPLSAFFFPVNVRELRLSSSGVPEKGNQ
ncbi:hypothetical protein ACQ4PT_034063 [Festuca glaucescens]